MMLLFSIGKLWPSYEKVLTSVLTMEVRTTMKPIKPKGPKSKITFRHAVTKDLVGTSLGRYSGKEQGAICDDLDRLQRERPEIRPDGITSAAWVIWGGKLPTASDKFASDMKKAIAEAEEIFEKAKSLPDREPVRGTPEDWSIMVDSMQEIHRQEIAARDEEIRNLNAILERYKKSAGEADEFEKEFTVWDAYLWAVANLISEKETQTKSNLARCAEVAELLGMETPLSEVDAVRINEVIDGVTTWGERSRLAHRHIAKRWFSELVDTMGFQRDPSKGLEVGSVATIYKWKEKETLDPREALKGLPEEWKLLVGLCGFAGLRLGEALRVKWEDLQKPVVKVSVTKRKTGDSTAPVRAAFAFSDLWKLVPAKHPKTGLIFDGIKNYDASADVGALVGHDPFLRLRRWYSTELRKRPELRGLESRSAGHDDQTAENHYQNLAEVMKAAGKVKA